MAKETQIKEQTEDMINELSLKLAELESGNIDSEYAVFRMVRALNFKAFIFKESL